LKKKYHLDGTIFQYKAQLVVHVFKQIQGIDYGETFSPFVKIKSLKTMIALAGAHNLHFHQMDMKTTFLNGAFNEEIYVLIKRLCSWVQIFKVYQNLITTSHFLVFLPSFFFPCKITFMDNHDGI
jgi:uncharacterized protein YukJ